MSRFCRRTAMKVILALLYVAALVRAEDSDSKSANYSSDTPEDNWGSYYDPSNVFCGKHDCYKILGFDYEYPPDKKELTQSYRELSKKWHPDKNKDKKANARFMKINKAYKILTSSKKRKEYDRLRDRPDEYFQKYGQLTYSYKPKSDTLMVVLVLLIIGSVFTWFAQKNRWQQIANRVVKDAVEGLKAGEGGSTESLELRAKAEEILKQQQGGVDFSDLVPGVGKKKNKKTKKEMKAFENEQLRPIIEELVLEIKDFGAGFHQPTWRDILVVRMLKWPFVIGKEITWQVKYYTRRLMKAELNDTEKEVLTSRAVGPVAWESANQKAREEMISMKLWIMENLEEWHELQEVKQLSTKEQKMYNKLKKKQLKNKAGKLD
ncbi:hypothetical protein CTEN210_14525 [Chaetoceros tenuissimus]|uniref:J domain-containing protein n=1 Tax=Chaetoceros tenuissimus TaxID=426638 RepID=A0AAD3D8P2_9STRA|nr:hypothetical protein CTEN210_14525 [Chaetoceros tenuissimus]